MLAAMVIGTGYALMFESKSVSNSVFLTIAMFVFFILFAIVAAYIETLVRTLRSGGPALIVSQLGISYRFASDECIPWSKIKESVFARAWGIKTGIFLSLSPDFSATLRRRGVVANSYKPDRVNINFRFIDAPKSDVERAILQHPCNLNDRGP